MNASNSEKNLSGIHPAVSSMFRGIAILIVIASHYAGWMYVEPVHSRAKEFISTLGPEGVDIFLLFSGYGLVKSAWRGRAKENGGSGISVRFVVRRLLSVYFPYLLVTGLINAYTGAWRETDARFILNWLTGWDYWYMQVLFVMYLMFMLIWRFCGRLRVPLLSAAILGYTVFLGYRGREDFWMLSNIAFLIGVYAAEGEIREPGRLSRGWYSLLTVGVVALETEALVLLLPEEIGVTAVKSDFSAELWIGQLFTLVILAVSRLLPGWKGYLLPLLGANSLYIYLLHTVLFYALVFKFDTRGYAFAAAVTGIITLAVSCLIGWILGKLTGLAEKQLIS